MKIDNVMLYVLFVSFTNIDLFISQLMSTVANERRPKQSKGAGPQPPPVLMLLPVIADRDDFVLLVLY